MVPVTLHEQKRLRPDIGTPSHPLGGYRTIGRGRQEHSWCLVRTAYVRPEWPDRPKANSVKRRETVAKTHGQSIEVVFDRPGKSRQRRAQQKYLVEDPQESCAA